MKKILQKTLFVASCALVAVGCGGGGSSSGGSTGGSSSLTTKADTAFSSSNWKNKTPKPVTNKQQASSITESVNKSLSALAATAGQKAQQGKKGKNTYNINETENGPKGGSATITGSFDVNASQTGYPITTSYNLKFVFSNYQDEEVSINGELTFKFTMNMTAEQDMTFDMQIDGGFSVLYQDEAYNLATKMVIKAETKTVDGVKKISTNFTITINGETYTDTLVEDF